MSTFSVIFVGLLCMPSTENPSENPAKNPAEEQVSLVELNWQGNRISNLLLSPPLVSIRLAGLYLGFTILDEEFSRTATGLPTAERGMYCS